MHQSQAPQYWERNARNLDTIDENQCGASGQVVVQQSNQFKYAQNQGKQPQSCTRTPSQTSSQNFNQYQNSSGANATASPSKTVTAVPSKTASAVPSKTTAAAPSGTTIPVPTNYQPSEVPQSQEANDPNPINQYTDDCGLPDQSYDTSQRLNIAPSNHSLNCPEKTMHDQGANSEQTQPAQKMQSMQQMHSGQQMLNNNSPETVRNKTPMQTNKPEQPKQTVPTHWQQQLKSPRNGLPPQYRVKGAHHHVVAVNHAPQSSQSEPVVADNGIRRVMSPPSNNDILDNAFVRQSDTMERMQNQSQKQFFNQFYQELEGGFYDRKSNGLDPGRSRYRMHRNPAEPIMQSKTNTSVLYFCFHLFLLRL